MSERVAKPVVDNRVFHQAAVGGKTFVGSVTTDGPYISCGNDGGVALGVCGLRKFLPDDWNGKSQRGWWVVKYTNEARIDLHTWRDEHAQELSSEFGIVIIDGWPWPPEEARQEHFFTSPAWEGLRNWVRAHPRLAAAHRDYQDYLFCWYERAQSELGLG